MVTAGTLLGNMFATGGCALHVHMQQEDVNFLDNGLLDFQDNTDPTIETVNFYINPHRFDNNTAEFSNIMIESQTYSHLYERVDIVVDVNDTRLDGQGNDAGGGAVAPYDVAYQIFNDSGEQLIDFITNLSFDDYPNNDQAEITFSNGTTQVQFEYIITNNPFTTPYDRFWNTRIKIGSIDDWNIDDLNYIEKEASVNEEANFKDGFYTLNIRTRDIDNDGINASNETETERHVLIDNFRPYLKTVSINELAGSPLYFANWTWNATDTTLTYGGSPNPFENISLITNGTQELQILVEVSEPLSSLNLMLNGTTPADAVLDDGDGTTWTIFLSPTTLAGLSSFQFLHFTGQDLAENNLLHT